MEMNYGQLFYTPMKQQILKNTVSLVAILIVAIYDDYLFNFLFQSCLVNYLQYTPLSSAFFIACCLRGVFPHITTLNAVAMIKSLVLFVLLRQINEVFSLRGESYVYFQSVHPWYLFLGCKDHSTKLFLIKTIRFFWQYDM